MVTTVTLNPRLNPNPYPCLSGSATHQVLQMSLQYVSTAIEMAPTYKILKPNMDYLLFQVARYLGLRPRVWS